MPPGTMQDPNASFTVVVSAIAFPSSSMAETLVVPCSALLHHLRGGRRPVADGLRQLAREVLGHHPPDPILHSGIEVGIADLLADGEELLLGLDHRVQEPLRAIAARARILALEHVQQRRDDEPAARRKRHPDDAVAPVRRLERPPLADLHAGEILQREDASPRGDARHHAARDAPLVERVRSVQSDPVQRAREVRLDQLVARRERLVFAVLAAAKEDARRLRIRRETVQPVLRCGDEAEVHREAAQRDLLGRAGELAERLLPETLHQLHVALHRGGDGDAERPGVGKVLPRLAVADVQVRPRRRGTHLAEVDRVHLPVARRVHQGETTAADPRALRLHDVQREGRGNRRIHRVPAPAQHACARLRRERMRGGDGAARGDGGEREQKGEHQHGGAL